MCEMCKNTNEWKFCPYCGHELHDGDDKPEMTQDEFDEIFLDMLRKANKVVWHNNGAESEIPTCKFELRNADNEWMFYVHLNSKQSAFYYSYYRVYEVFNSQYGLKRVDIQRLMKKQLGLLFNMDGVTPLDTCLSSWSLRVLFNMNEATPSR